MNLRFSLVRDTQVVYQELVQSLVVENDRAKIFNEVTAELFPGYNSITGLQLDLNDSQSNDLRRRSTTKGPHKADIIFESKGSLIKEKFSRGEQKLLSIIWSISQNIMLGRVYKLETNSLY